MITQAYRNCFPMCPVVKNGLPNIWLIILTELNGWAGGHHFSQVLKLFTT